MEEKREKADTNITNSDSNGWIKMTLMRLRSGKTGFIVDISNSPEPIIGIMKKSLEDTFVGMTPMEKYYSVMDLLDQFRLKYCPNWMLQTIDKLSFGTTPTGILERVFFVAHYGNAGKDIIVPHISTQSRR